MRQGRMLDEGSGLGTLHMRAEDSGEHRTLALQGDIDIATVAALEAALRAMAAHATRLVVDLSDVTFIDSTGLQRLLVAHDAADGLGCKLVVVGARPRVARMLEITGMRGTPPFSE